MALSDAGALDVNRLSRNSAMSGGSDGSLGSAGTDLCKRHGADRLHEWAVAAAPGGLAERAGSGAEQAQAVPRRRVGDCGLLGHEAAEGVSEQV